MNHGFAAQEFSVALGASIAAVIVWAALNFAVGRILNRYNIVDTGWGLGFCLIAAVDFVASGVQDAGDDVRRGMLLAAVLLWGLRLSWHVGRRSAGKGEDPRYADLLDRHPGDEIRTAIRLIYLPQSVTLLVVSLPVQVGMFDNSPVRVLGWIGVAVWAVGLAFEAVGDRQMSAFKSDPDNRGRLIDVGLWRYTRHPNYFGDACVWIGVFLIAAERWPGVLTVVSPILMTYLLAFGTGKKLLEKSMADRPGYREYMRRTSGFVPWPPRH